MSLSRNHLNVEIGPSETGRVEKLLLKQIPDSLKGRILNYVQSCLCNYQGHPVR
jgi:hypothetical protein